MFDVLKRKLAKTSVKSGIRAGISSALAFSLEGLEGRQLLSGGHGGPGGGFGGFGGPGGDHGGHGGDHGGSGRATITFSQLPTAIQTGLDNLAATDKVTAPAPTATVFLGNSNGVETYTVDIQGTGTDTKLTVDQAGNAVTAPTRTSTIFGTLGTTAAAAATEISAIATGLGLTAPTATTNVDVTTASDGTVTYSVNLAGTSGSRHGGGRISVDANGNPVGNQRVPLSTLSAAVQAGLKAGAPTGATALTGASLVDVRTVDGVTLYSATYTGTGTRTTVTVNSAGVATSLPSSKQVTFVALTAPAKTELQTLATADGFTGTIADTQAVTEYDEANGAIVYSVNLPITGTTSTYTINIAVDSNGNPTVAPRGGGFGGSGFCGGGGGRGSDFGGSDDDGSTSSGTSTGTTTTGTTTTGTTTTTFHRHSRHGA